MVWQFANDKKICYICRGVMGKKKQLPSDEVLALALEREVLKPEVKMSHCENRKEIIKMPDSNN